MPTSVLGILKEVTEIDPNRNGYHKRNIVVEKQTTEEVKIELRNEQMKVIDDYDIGDEIIVEYWQKTGKDKSKNIHQNHIAINITRP